MKATCARTLGSHLYQMAALVFNLCRIYGKPENERADWREREQGRDGALEKSTHSMSKTKQPGKHRHTPAHCQCALGSCICLHYAFSLSHCFPLLSPAGNDSARRNIAALVRRKGRERERTRETNGNGKH